MKTTSVILAAGQGTRMKSALPKVLHPLLGRAMIFYAIEAARQVCASPPVVVVGHGASAVQQAVGEAARFVTQEPQLGTGHAVLQALPLLRGEAEAVLVTTADMPLLRVETLAALVNAQAAHGGPLTVLTAPTPEGSDFGRVVRGADKRVLKIVEAAHASPQELAIREGNTAIYCFDAAWLEQALPRIPLSPKGEYYLTDLVEMAASAGLPVQAVSVSSAEEALGVNNRVQLAEAEAVLRQRINRRWMLEGVTLIDPATTYIEPGVRIGQDTVIWPNTFLQGETVIGENCVLGPNTVVRDTRLGNRCKALASVLEKAVLEDDVDIGPYGHLRKGAHLANGVHIGNFGEVKDSYLGPGTKMGHFSYIGNANIGPEVNIGAGTITCNYDGERKHPTEIGAGVFIGSDTMLVAPLKVGDGARTGAGAVVTKDVPADTLAVGMPARVIRRLKKRG
ncbi:MAG: bifunctional UDP-N-acetylglucosamine diphosphorylase/glucosamine-1-phosphate N-acetyltransferase GlmU [Chloroflexi bacterium]|nr:bifunctional UDP-N-acetylglucosamine diphosphorylase/glucosamine-1-phosphate N-acetyltransferase GlmU [Chloroflexota bacterium]